jgi:LacI family transcriptional regulator
MRQTPPAPFKSAKPHSLSIAVLVDTASGWGRRLIRGVTAYADRHAGWRLWFEPLGRSEAVHLPHDWDGDGVIARIGSLKLAEKLHDLKKPVVNVSAIDIKPYSFTRVTNDNLESARLAAEHFIERGFRNFAYVGPLHHEYVRAHAEAFAQETADRRTFYDSFDYLHESMTRRSWLARRESLGNWLESLPKPVGLFSWATTAAVQVLDVCRIRNIDSPSRIAVLAGDDDDLLCEATKPRLSAVVTASEQVGFHAAELLHQLILNPQAPVREVKVKPLHIKTRQSTDVLAVPDEDLAAALAIIHNEFSRPITVQEVADRVAVSRRTLERGFQEFFGRTPLEEIRRLRLERARQLLIDTDLPISRVAVLSGFGTPEYLSVKFTAEYGKTPLRYRKGIRNSSGGK